MSEHPLSITIIGPKPEKTETNLPNPSISTRIGSLCSRLSRGVLTFRNLMG